jgi:glycosyltransferase involved in cell wall biosynthesis
VAASLAQSGELAQFATGVAFRKDGWSGWLASRLAVHRPVLRNRILAGLPAGRLRALPLVELASRATARGLRALGVPARTYDAVFTAHDAVVSRLPWPAGTTAVYAYEDGALWTFARAAKQGIARVWDLPLPHYRVIEDLFRDESLRWPGAMAGPPHAEPDWKRQRKDGELALATKVVVASAFTRSSLDRLDLEVPVAVVPYGFPVDEFAPKPSPPAGIFTVLAVGTHDLRKGTPYLLEAWRRAALPEAELHLVGPMRLAKSFVDRYAGLFRHWPHVPRAELGARYAAADVLAFPTLGDGFGVVIQEAMCSATPVITTPCGGGPECITSGVNGWVIPPRDIDALIDRLRFCASHRDDLSAMGRAARVRAEQWTWSDNNRAMVGALDSTL